MAPSDPRSLLTPPVGESGPPTARSVLQQLLTAASPLAVGTGLLFYFGWVRANVEARDLGYDAAVIGFSTQDYILQSINVLYPGTIGVLLITFLLAWLHQWLTSAAEASERVRARAVRLGALLISSWSAWTALAVLVVVLAPATNSYVPGIALTMALLCAVYGIFLIRRLGGSDTRAAGLLPLILVLLALAAFLDTERLARAMGHAFAADLQSNPAQMASVTVVTPRLLDLGQGSNAPQPIRQPDGSTTYRYGGLRLLQRSGDRYVLVPASEPGRRPRVIVLRDSDLTMVDLSR